jgi:hypothetical protein
MLSFRHLYSRRRSVDHVGNIENNKGLVPLTIWSQDPKASSREVSTLEDEIGSVTGSIAAQRGIDREVSAASRSKHSSEHATKQCSVSSLNPQNNRSHPTWTDTTGNSELLFGRRGGNGLNTLWSNGSSDQDSSFRRFPLLFHNSGSRHHKYQQKKPQDHEVNSFSSPTDDKQQSSASIVSALHQSNRSITSSSNKVRYQRRPRRWSVGHGATASNHLPTVESFYGLSNVSDKKASHLRGGSLLSHSPTPSITETEPTAPLSPPRQSRTRSLSPTKYTTSIVNERQRSSSQVRSGTFPSRSPSSVKKTSFEYPSQLQTVSVVSENRNIVSANILPETLAFIGIESLKNGTSIRFHTSFGFE